MKAFVICSVVGGLGFFAMGMQLGLFGNQRKLTNLFPEMVGEKKPAPPRAKFPADLAPAAKGQAVDVAADYEVADRPHKLAFLRTNGSSHPWLENHGNYHEEWSTTRVEETELVVVVGNSREMLVEHVIYPKAPPIDRFQYDLEAWLVEAKTGAVLATRKFQNRPRAVRNWEDFALTKIGEPVSYHTVFRWVSEVARRGAPTPPVIAPVVTVIE